MNRHALELDVDPRCVDRGRDNRQYCPECGESGWENRCESCAGVEQKMLSECIAQYDERRFVDITGRRQQVSHGSVIMREDGTIDRVYPYKKEDICGKGDDKGTDTE